MGLVISDSIKLLRRPLELFIYFITPSAPIGFISGEKSVVSGELGGIGDAN